jgi:hypothetical protein
MLPLLFAGSAIGVAAAAVLIEPDLAATRHDRKVRGIVLGAISGALLIAAWAATRPRVVFDERGLRARRLLRETSIAWDDVDRYGYYASSGKSALRANAVVRAVNAIASARVRQAPHRTLEYGRMRVVSKDGRVAAFNAGLFFGRQRVQDAFDLACREVHQRLRARQDLSFAPFSFGDMGLMHPAFGPLGLDVIERAEIHDGSLDTFRVFRRDAAQPWMKAHLSAVTNPWLFVEDLRRRGVPVAIDPGVFVPRDVSVGS